ncbi:metal ABC transporter substrate-binding protein [Terasakiispira papahanaumokuakeensis]|uniref:Metal ABC transporter substrate-binding protein n=1 Tax=Terasakiispira papahanaumokuakeensis TaxID=197479 RepID=A0A1E2VD73_9GAMM|nr:zinc ABC transporter substrate-binding protein [Terasakiispira papahanaumokuakeensis]ODC04914.1 metal ABC transporter substrate-binding protein [Terasakiispira papahanaumokuakeensis]
MKAKPLWLALAGSLVLSLGCVGTASAKTIDVVTSFTVLSDVVQHVGGEHVNVKSLVPPNGDPHAFEPSPEDAKALGSAAVSFISGEGLENWFQRLATASGAHIDPVVVSKGIQTHTFEDEGHAVTDPHVWNSIPNVLIWVDNIEQALIAADPEDADAFKDNADAYRQSLRTLNEQIHQQINAVPKAQRKVLTSHDAFGYYGEEYGVTFLSPLGMSTETEASAADVAQLIDQIKAQHIKVYFIENSNDARLIKQIAKATNARPGGELYPEALSEADGPAPTYEALMRYNTDQIVRAITSE